LPKYGEIAAIQELKNRSFAIVLNLMENFFTQENFIQNTEICENSNREEEHSESQFLRTVLITQATNWYEELMNTLNDQLIEQKIEFGLIDETNFRMKPFPVIYFRLHSSSTSVQTMLSEQGSGLQEVTQNINPMQKNLTLAQKDESAYQIWENIIGTEKLEQILRVNDSLSNLIMEDDDVEFDFLKLDRMMSISKRKVHAVDQYGNVVMSVKNKFVKAALEMDSEGSEISNSTKLE
jgi:hypothetical protein